MDPSLQTKGFLYNVRHMFDLRDVAHDMGEVVESHVDTATHVRRFFCIFSCHV